MESKTGQQATFVLPLGVITRSDAGRLLREMEAIEDFLEAAAIRKPGTTLQLPKTSPLLEEFMSTNNLNSLQTDNRQYALALLKNLHSQAPVVHISFATSPSPLFLQKLITWMRQQIHPQLLLHIGLQPTQAAGCVVRTTNKYFDFSLRQRFTDKRELLSALLRQDETAKPAQEKAA